MTKKLKKGLIALFILGAIALLLGWASSWYRNWKFSSWLNYWGKGAPTTATVTEGQEAAHVRAAANAGLTHDSDLSESVTAEVKQYDRPDVTLYDEYFQVTCDGLHGRSIRVTITKFMGEFIRVLTFSDSRGESYGVLQISYSDIYEACGEGVRSIGFCNVGEGDYKDSLVNGQTYYVMKDSDRESTMIMDGTHVKIPFPTAPTNTEYTYYYTVKIVAGSSSETFKSNVSNDSGLYSVVQSDNEQYIDVDLTKLSFVNEVHSSVFIQAELSCKFGYYTVRCLHTCYGVTFAISKLDTPSNVKYEDGILSWNSVEGAEGYAVFNGNDLYKTTQETSLNLVISELEVGTYTMRVRALGNVGTALAANDISLMTAYNASSRITQLVTLTFVVNNSDNITKLVPYGSVLKDYLYEVIVPGKHFGGWFYDSGYSVAADPTAKLVEDTTIYVRLMDAEVTQPKLTWWDKYHWWVIGGAIALVVAGAVAGVVVGIKKDKQK